MQTPESLVERIEKRRLAENQNINGEEVSLLNSISYEVLYYERLAQWTLYEALFGLAENRFSHLNIAVQTLQNSFVKTGRLDAEYYQPKYERLIEIIKKYKKKPILDHWDLCSDRNV